MTSEDSTVVVDRMLTVQEAAARLNTSTRFPRRLIAERRIAFVHIGRHVRIPESAIEDFIRDGLVEPAADDWRFGRAVGYATAARGANVRGTRASGR